MRVLESHNYGKVCDSCPFAIAECRSWGRTSTLRGLPIRMRCRMGKRTEASCRIRGRTSNLQGRLNCSWGIRLQRFAARERGRLRADCSGIRAAVRAEGFSFPGFPRRRPRWFPSLLRRSCRPIRSYGGVRRIRRGASGRCWKTSCIPPSDNRILHIRRDAYVYCC